MHGIMPEDKYICTFTQGGVKQELYQRPNATQYIIEAVSGVYKEKPKKEPHLGTGQYGFHGVHKPYVATGKAACKHLPNKEVAVGHFKVYPFAFSDSYEKDIVEANVNPIYALTSSLFGRLYHTGFTGRVYGIACPDRDTLPKTAHLHYVNEMCEFAKKGKKVGFYCLGGHGRTGTILASMIALVEAPADPIKVARERYCEFIVETKVQAELVFACMNKALPAEYKKEFKPVHVKPFVHTGQETNYGTGMVEHYGFSWYQREYTKDIPKWLIDIPYLDMPLLRELDRDVRIRYGDKLEGIQDTWRPCMFSGYPAIAPGDEKGTWWLIDKETTAAILICFKSHLGDDGDVLEYQAKLARKHWANVPMMEKGDKSDRAG